MSNHLAIATVTAALKTLVSRGAHVIPGAQVSSVRPDAIGKDGLLRGVNIFLYLATINAAMENRDTPLRRADGTLVNVPSTPLDLHYLFTFYGDESLLEPQLLLASTFAEIRRQPVLTPALIREAMAAMPSPDLSRSDLADQLPRVNITPSRLELELLHKLWPSFQTPYNLSATFQCSVVLVDSDVAPPQSKRVETVNLTTEPEV